MNEAITPEERKQRIRERYKRAVLSPPCFDINGLRVAVYRRTSPQSVEQISSCQLIVQEYRERARRHNWILKGVYSDEGWEDHTALDKLLDDCGEIDLVLIWSINHISRDMDKALEITKEIEARSVVIYFEGENILGSRGWERLNSLMFPQEVGGEPKPENQN